MSKINVCIFTSRMLLLVACFRRNTGLEDFAKGDTWIEVTPCTVCKTHSAKCEA